MRESHREVCPPGTNVLATSESKFEAQSWVPVKQRVSLVWSWKLGHVCYSGLT